VVEYSEKAKFCIAALAKRITVLDSERIEAKIER